MVKEKLPRMKGSPLRYLTIPQLKFALKVPLKKERKDW